MMDNIEAKVKELVTDFKLEEALDVLIAQAQTQNQRKQNALLVLKGKLALLEEQNLSGMLDPSDVARQKATIAHQILDIADGSPLDHDISKADEPRVLVQKTVSVPSSSGGFTKYLLMALILIAVVVVGIFISKNVGEKNSAKADEANIIQPREDSDPSEPTPGGGVKVLNFPSLQLAFNFLDNRIDFRWADAEWISDNEIRLKIRYYLTCKSNLGICYRPSIRLYADGRPLAPTDQSNTAGWVEHEATITDDINFVFPSDTKTFEIELSRDESTWRRPFAILMK